MQKLKKLIPLFSFLFLFIGLDLEAQVYDRRGQVIYIEGGGPAVAYSVNYETRFQETTEGLGARLGIGYTNTWLAVPVNINFLFGKEDKSHFLELGAGITYFRYLKDFELGGELVDNQIIGAFTIMYRLHPRYKKFFFKIGITPLVGKFETEEDIGVESLPWIGFAVGRAF